ncbi:MAG: peptide deformylase [Oscillospiraceae bacterium]|nr:peptide deformylase [Oscillospiraceae bacterium]
MAIRNIVQEGDSILTKMCRPVTNFDERLGLLLDDMKETLAKANGAGLAGPQVGVLRRVFVMIEISEAEEEQEENAEPVYKFIEAVNPVIVGQEGVQTGYEGCLSFPGRAGEVTRPLKVTMRAQDRTGKEFTYTGEGINARCICHECDHLDGVTILDRAEYFYEEEDEG